MSRASGINFTLSRYKDSLYVSYILEHVITVQAPRVAKDATCSKQHYANVKFITSDDTQAVIILKLDEQSMRS